ncbi:aminopeptidase [Flexivirga endophytica]|uniref:Aminopeptidase N n=1 Tax=Flexivirga endophytica TaxID=1849103 RepID=A0A916T2H2_9MICO|nr:aminopeptidase N [Flexivirga endophytica]GGB28105.1 aminopeptidase [Flexivirga endophytica]GHB61954.1 aminopeptidase [Flexivirga endophytica]
MGSLLRTEAEARADLIDLTSYDVALDLDQGAETFGSEVTIGFDCREPGASTFLDLEAVSVISITLNGEDIDPATVADRRVTMAGLAPHNTVRVVSVMRYRQDGEGLHRAVDPADGRHYVYGMSFLDAGPSIFACFDQPDLKAPYDVRVRAPHDWIVAGNGAAERTAPGEWTLATTPPLSTYFVTICAGPYAVETDEHDGIPLGIYVRASLAKQLAEQRDDIFEVTKQSFDYYHRLFGIRYPWGKYDQFFVPEFNAGAMENPGCVTLRDDYVFRGAHTRTELLTRANTIAHEMAHMWFGDLVTMQWWDDLWLNESFAEYMAHRTTAEATQYTEAWVDFGISRKTWGYGVDRSPSTHPIAGASAPDAESALTNFDGISYAKGASALRQLAAYVGDDAFIAGVRKHLTDNSFGNATMSDFLGAVEAASGRSLTEWTEAWLRSSGVDEISVDVHERDGVIERAELVVTPPEGGAGGRPHVLEIGAISDGHEERRVSVQSDTTRTTLTELAGAPRPKLLLPNVSDLTWATSLLDERSLDSVVEELAASEDPLTRLAIWSALLSGADTGRIDPIRVVEAFGAAWPQEPVPSLSDTLSGRVRTLYPYRLVPHADSADASAVLQDAGRRRLASVDGTSPSALTAARLVAATSTDANLLSQWASDVDRPAAAAGDQDFSWAVVARQAELGQIASADVDRAAAADESLSGHLATLRSRAALPTEEAKTWAWDQLFGTVDLSNYEGLAIAQGFFAGYGENAAAELLRSYVDQFFAALPIVPKKFGDMAAEKFVLMAFPHRVVERAVADAARTAIDSSDNTAGVRRALADSLDRLDRALVAQDRYSTAASKHPTTEG